MTETTTPPVVRSYLAELDAALVGVADATARDIRDAIAEELTGLDGPTAARRIEQLGDPFFIAAEARESAGETALGEPSVGAPTSAIPPAQQAVASPARVDSPGYVVLASLLVALGGLVLPLLGWIAGIVMVWASEVWTRREKLWATLLPLGAMVVVTIVAIAVFLAALTEPPPGSAEYRPAETTNPVIPFTNVAWYNIVASALLVLILVNFAVGLTLLARARRRRRAEEASSSTGNAAPLIPAQPQASVADDRTDSVGYVLLASLLVALGGMVIPVLGWVAGIVMVWVSRAWSRAEKWAAVLLPVGAVLVTAAGITIAVAIDRGTAGQSAAEQGASEFASSSDGFYGPRMEDFSPLIPAWYDVLWSSALVLILVNFAVGIALLVRAIRRRRISE